jgi:hypothetical protein
MSSADPPDVASDRPCDHVGLRPVPSGPLGRHPSVDDVTAFAPVDQNGAIARSFLRRQPVHIVADRIEGGYTSVFEIICCDCGDDPFLDYSEVSLRLQQLRGPYTLLEGFAAYSAHLR